VSTIDDARRRIRALQGRGVGAALGGEQVDGYAAVTAHHRTLYWSVPAPLLFDAVDAHGRLGRALLGARAPAALRARLAAATAESLLLAGRIAFFDLQAPDSADGRLLTALDAAETSGDRALAAAVLAHRAFIPAFAGRPREARDLVRAARSHGANALTGVQSAWMHAVAAEVEARFGAGEGAMGLLARSADDLTANSEPCPEWLDYFDAARHDAFTGYCARAAGLPAQAEAALTRSVETLPPSADKQRTIVHADLAAVLLADRRVDECIDHLHQALSVMERQWYATALLRIQALRTRLTPYARLPEVADLDDRLRTLTRARARGEAAPTQAT